VLFIKHSGEEEGSGWRRKGGGSGKRGTKLRTVRGRGEGVGREKRWERSSIREKGKVGGPTPAAAPVEKKWRKVGKGG